MLTRLDKAENLEHSHDLLRVIFSNPLSTYVYTLRTALRQRRTREPIIRKYRVFSIE